MPTPDQSVIPDNVILDIGGVCRVMVYRVVMEAKRIVEGSARNFLSKKRAMKHLQSLHSLQHSVNEKVVTNLFLRTGADGVNDLEELFQLMEVGKSMDWLKDLIMARMPVSVVWNLDAFQGLT